MEKIKIFAFADEADSSIDGQIKAMLRNSLDGLEIRNVDGANISDISISKAREVKAKLDDNGLIIWSLGSPIGKINITDNFSTHLDKFKHTLLLAHELGAENIRLFSFYIPEGVTYSDCRAEVIERMSYFVETAKGSGIRLCHENEKGIYGDNAAHCLDLFREVGGLDGIFDPANFVQCGEDTQSAWEKLKGHIRYMHIKDARKDGVIVPAGQGDGNIKKIVSDFLSLGGNAFTMEPHLMEFDGLSTLERAGEKSNIVQAFSDSNTAFDFACDAFKELL